MSKMNSKKGSSFRDWIIRVSIIVVSTISIVFFLPREDKFNYQFEINKPWSYEQLIATSDFPIYKDQFTIEAEKDSVLKLFQPYYRYDKTVEMQQLELLREVFNNRLQKTIPYTYLTYASNQLRAIYAEGVMESEQLYQLQDSVTTIQVIADNSSIAYSLKGIYSTRSAYERVMSADTTLYDLRLLQLCNLNEYIHPNLIYDSEKSEAQKRELIASLSYANGMVQSGQKIIDRGEIVTQHTYNILESLRKESEKLEQNPAQMRVVLFGQIVLVGILLVMFTLYITLFRKNYYNNPRGIALLFFMLIIFPVTTSWLAEFNSKLPYLIPYAMIAIFVRVFMDSRTAVMTHTITVGICSLAMQLPYEFMMLQVVTGLVCIYSLRELSQRSQLIRTAALVVVVSVLFHLGFELIRSNNLQQLDLSYFSYIALNGVLLLFAYPLMFMLERVFGFTSNVTLVELTNGSNELLRKMSEVAPGTFQHSVQVSNLAAEVANKIGARSQLVRTGALYHDIGKIERPAFFTENQAGINPHTRLRFDQSAQVIIAHVRKGVELADKYNLPKAIKEFIVTHHGTGKAKYFYISFKNAFPDEEIDESLFAYPGPNPSTREQAILMMADSVEAASHSLKEYTEESLSQMVNTIIDSQVDEGFFKNCPITFADIATAKEIFIEKLHTVYHTRISYPELKTAEPERNINLE